MRIFNKTKNVLVSDDVLVLKTLKEKSEGILAFDTVRPLYFETRWGIHTFGMKYPIDVVVLDEKGVVKETEIGMKPNRMLFWNPKYKRIIELPPKGGIEYGDVLEVS